MFLPTTRAELDRLGWDACDVILVSGDSYIDSPYIGVAVIGKALLKAGYRVGVIAQPAVDQPTDITRLGEPRLFWGVTAGSVDSMVANYTATRKKRHSDDYTPGGENNRRPDRASIVYTGLIRRFFKNTRPIVLGGIEASLRRVAHYDYWSDRIRPSLLFDAKADLILYGMAESSVVLLADRLRDDRSIQDVAGLCYIAREPREDYITLPSYETVVADKKAFIQMFDQFYQNNDPVNAKGLCQQFDARWVIQNPPAPYLTGPQLDDIYETGYERAQHPYYEQSGPVKALETIRYSVSTHRGCYGECNFCAIAVHEGRTVRWRTEDSIVREVETLAQLDGFKGYVQDVGGPTANMYGIECTKKQTKGACQLKRCLHPDICPVIKIDHSRQINLLRRIRAIPGVKKAFIASGIRYDLILKDKKFGEAYLADVVEHHTSGQMKVAPEHIQPNILKLMGKPSQRSLVAFKDMFDRVQSKAPKKMFLTYYLIAAYPGCAESDMQKLRDFASETLHIHPEQVQVFTPTPSTWASVMYYTEMDPETLRPVFVEKDVARKERQKKIVTG